MRDLHKSHEKQINKMFKELDQAENYTDQEANATLNAFQQLQ